MMHYFTSHACRHVQCLACKVYKLNVEHVYCTVHTVYNVNHFRWSKNVCILRFWWIRRISVRIRKQTVVLERGMF